MTWLSNLLGQGQGGGTDSPEAIAAAAARLAQWEGALAHNTVPDFVTARLKDAAKGTVPWMSTMTPAELLLSRSHGIRPVAMVSGTCWYHYGYSWTKGHAEGWHAALARMKHEAIAAGANAPVRARPAKARSRCSAAAAVRGRACRDEARAPARRTMRRRSRRGYRARPARSPASASGSSRRCGVRVSSMS